MNSKILSLLIFMVIFLFSCQNKLITNSYQNKSHIQTDTLVFDYRDTLFQDFALLHLVEKNYGKDSICEVKYKIDFWKNNEFVSSSIFGYKGYSEESMSSSYYIDTTNTAFKRVCIGYPACGYAQNCFLFYTTNTSSKLIHHSIDVGDGGWGSGTEYFVKNENQIISRNFSFWPDEESENPDEIGLLEYSDSITFFKQNNNWKTKKITPKGKVYKTEKKKFDEYYGE